MDMATLPVTEDEFRYLLVMGDTFTKFIEAEAVKDQTAGSITKAIYKRLICRYGCPTKVLSDQGRNFEASAFKKLCDKFGIQKLRSAAFYPHGNGFAERTIGSVKQILRSVLLEMKLPQKSWIEILPQVLLALDQIFSI